MPSRDELRTASQATPQSPVTSGHARGRSALEALCRVGAILAVLTALWRMTAERSSGAMLEPARLVIAKGVTDSMLAASLIRVSTAAASVSATTADKGGVAAHTIPLQIEHLPTPGQRAMLGVLAQSGVAMSWRDASGSRGLAAHVVRDAGPGQELLVRATLPRGVVTLRDAGGLLDSLVINRDCLMAWRLGAASAPLRLATARATLSLPLAPSARPKLLRVMGEPGWEYKFTVAALEEAGWRVDGAVRVSPTSRVLLGADAVLDTARHAAVIITDSTTVDAASLRRFVQRGGGLVLLGDALRIPSLASLRPAQATERHPAVAGGLETDRPLSGLERWELTPLAGAQILEEAPGDAEDGHAHEEALLVARRVGAGRVVASAFRDVWRWRMEGLDSGLEAHRRWWQDVLAAAGAPSPAAALTAAERTPLAGDGAPYADLVGWIGATTDTATDGVRDAVTDSATTPVSPSGQDAAQVARSTASRTRWSAWLGVLAIALFCVEWGSRRLRGLR